MHADSSCCASGGPSTTTETVALIVVDLVTLNSTDACCYLTGVDWKLRFIVTIVGLVLDLFVLWRDRP